MGSTRGLSAAQQRGILVGQANGVAQYCREHRVPHAEAMQRIHEITTDPLVLAEAAASVAGGGLREALDWPLRAVAARLLLDAGADLAEMRVHLRVIADNAVRGSGGFGVPQKSFLTDEYLDASMQMIQATKTRS